VKLLAFCYYGGKASHLNKILPCLATPHDVFCELFSGSCSVTLNKPRAKVEILNDAWGDLINFWTVIRDQSEVLKQSLADTPAGEAEFKRIAQLAPTEEPVERARRFFVIQSQSFSSIPNSSSHSMERASRFVSRVNSLEYIADRLAGVMIENTDANRLLRRVMTNIPRKQVLFYADPPYISDSRVSQSVYALEEFDHEQFLNKCKATNAKFAISGYDSDLYNDILVDWNKTTWDCYCSANPKKNPRVEVLWTNYEPQSQSIL